MNNLVISEAVKKSILTRIGDPKAKYVDRLPGPTKFLNTRAAHREHLRLSKLVRTIPEVHIGMGDKITSYYKGYYIEWFLRELSYSDAYIAAGGQVKFLGSRRFDTSVRNVNKVVTSYAEFKNLTKDRKSGKVPMEIIHNDGEKFSPWANSEFDLSYPLLMPLSGSYRDSGYDSWYVTQTFTLFRLK